MTRRRPDRRELSIDILARTPASGLSQGATDPFGDGGLLGARGALNLAPFDLNSIPSSVKEQGIWSAKKGSREFFPVVAEPRGEISYMPNAAAFAASVSGLKIDVDTDAGIVTLKGTVSSRAEGDHAVMLARSTGGVKKVIDNLTVR